MRPETLPIKAINQYRKRDILAYLGLRYYLENQCTLSDIWGDNVAIHLLKTRTIPAYFQSYHYKDMNEDGSVFHRNIYIPGPNEIMAETALLNECSDKSSFQVQPCVYSYHFTERNSKDGIFRSYFPGYQERHQSIAKSCKELNNSVVRYTDIEKFYPTISKELALNTWNSACDASNLSTKYRELGICILEGHLNACLNYGNGLSILTGPMFSHLIANLVLKKVDSILFATTKGRYWRYVDDIVLVGEQENVKKSHNELSQILNDMGFELHKGDKDFEIDSQTWLKGENDFNDDSSKLWMNLIGNIKRFLVVNPEQKILLNRAFSNEGINIPLLDYSNAVKEATYLEKLSDMVSRNHWLRKIMRSYTVGELLKEAINCREYYLNKIKYLLSNTSPAIKGYDRKRLIPKLRFYASRLMYLATPEGLSNINSAIKPYPELRLLNIAIESVLSRDITKILQFGSNAIQTAAQILRITNEPVVCTLSSFNPVQLQGLAILRLNGINIKFTDCLEEQTKADELNQFALGINMLNLMKSDNPFIKEIASLRGVDNDFEPSYLVDYAFDRDESLALDIINQLQKSSYF